MKKLLPLLIFIIAIFCPDIKAQDEKSISDSLRREMFSTYGYCKSQEWALQKISEKFPQLRIEVLKAESELNVTFGKSCKNPEKT